MDMYKQTAEKFYTGQGTSGSTAAPLLASGYSIKVHKSVIVRATADNSVSIYVGPSGVTTGTGYILKAGESVTILIDDPSKVFVVSTDTATYSWIAS